MNDPIYEPEPGKPSRTQLLPWILPGGLMLLVALMALRYATRPIWQYKDSLVLRVLASESALPLGAIDSDKDVAGEVDTMIAYLEMQVKRVWWDVDDYGFPLCHIEPREESVANVAHFLSNHADRSAVVDVDGRAVHVIRLAESSPERLVLRFGYPWRSPDDQPFRDREALHEHLLERIR